MSTSKNYSNNKEKTLIMLIGVDEGDECAIAAQGNHGLSRLALAGGGIKKPGEHEFRPVCFRRRLTTKVESSFRRTSHLF